MRRDGRVRLKHLGVDGRRENRFRQIAQVQLEYSGDRVDVTLLQKLLGLVGVRLVGLLQPAHVGSRPGHAVDADFSDAAALNFPDAGRDDERHRSLLAFRRKPDRRPEESARLRRRHATHRLLEGDVLDAARQDDVVHGDPLLRQLVAQPGPGKRN